MSGFADQLDKAGKALSDYLRRGGAEGGHVHGGESAGAAQETDGEPPGDILDDMGDTVHGAVLPDLATAAAPRGASAAEPPVGPPDASGDAPDEPPAGAPETAEAAGDTAAPAADSPDDTETVAMERPVLPLADASAAGSEDPGTGAFAPPPAPARPGRPLHPARGLPDRGGSVPDTVLDEADYPGLALRAASLRGGAHRLEGECRQDSFGMYGLEAGELRAVLVCVADGVGGRSMSHRGAASACDLLSQLVDEHLGGLIGRDADDSRDLCERIVARVARGMADLAASEGVDDRELSTTLTAALVELTPEGETARVLLLAVGDSPAHLLREGLMEPLSVVDRTAALPADIRRVHVSGHRLAPGETLLLCTGGLAGPMDDADVTGRLLGWWGGDGIPGRMEFGWQVDFRTRSHDDDRTVVCVWGR